MKIPNFLSYPFNSEMSFIALSASRSRGLTDKIKDAFALQFGTDVSEEFCFVVASERNRYRRAVEIKKSEWLSLMQEFVSNKVTSISVQATEEGKPPILKIQ